MIFKMNEAPMVAKPCHADTSFTIGLKEALKVTKSHMEA